MQNAHFADAGGGTATDPVVVPIIAFDGVVEEGWIDINRHMRSMAYVSLFWNAATVFYHYIGINGSYLTERRLSLFQRESHLAYERELRLGDPIQIRSWLIKHDAKRIHHFHELWHTGANYRAATMEALSLHIDLTTRRVAAMPEDIKGRLNDFAAGYANLERPSGTNGQIRLELRDHGNG